MRHAKIMVDVTNADKEALDLIEAVLNMEWARQTADKGLILDAARKMERASVAYTEKLLEDDRV